jgi:acetylglutamate kinase
MPIVIKYGGNAMTDANIRIEVAKEIRQLAQQGLEPIVVHGGGPFIKAALDKSNIAHHFVRGLRVTTPESLPIIEQVLNSINKELAQEIGDAVGLSGRDSHLLRARIFDEKLGLVGKMTQVNASLLKRFLTIAIIPVLSCVAENDTGEGILNVNADEVASAVAGELQIPVIFLTDVPGVLDNPGDPASVLLQVSSADIQERIKDGRIAGGMIPKVEAALDALQRGAKYAVIADGRNANTVTKTIKGQSGTRIDL